MSLTPLARRGQLYGMSRTSRLPLQPAQVEAVAAAADVSTKTLRRYLSGASVLGSTLRRITAALVAAGHDPQAIRAAAFALAAQRAA